MKCPIDSSELEKKIYENNVEIDYCNTCQGVWLDKGELEAIQQTRVNDYSDRINRVSDYPWISFFKEKERAGEVFICPKCSGQLTSSNYGFGSQIFIDRCGKCGGVWLDMLELKDMEVFYEKFKKDETKFDWNFFKKLMENLKVW